MACIDYNKTHDKKIFKLDVIKYMRFLGLKYINAGYDGTFIKWLLTNNPMPYNSWGNGSAMRVSPVAYVSSSLEEVLELSRISAEVTHNHPEGIKGAQAIASCVFLAKEGVNKTQIKKFVNDNFYNLNFTISDIRESYNFDVSCQGSVPQAIVSFLESDSFEDAVRNAISIGGDSDTIAAMSGSIAQAYYGILKKIQKIGMNYLDEQLKSIVIMFSNQIIDKDVKSVLISKSVNK